MKNINDWNVEKIGCNIACFYTKGRKDVVKLEYKFDKNTFIFNSGYLITQHFTMNNRSYNRLKSGNVSKYYKLLYYLPIDKGLALFK